MEAAPEQNRDVFYPPKRYGKRKAIEQLDLPDELEHEVRFTPFRFDDTHSKKKRRFQKGKPGTPNAGVSR